MIIGILLDEDLRLGVLLLLITKDTDVPRWVVSLGNVEALRALAELLEVLNGLFVELDFLEVLTDTRGSDRFGDDGVVAENRPSNDDLGGGDSLAPGGSESVGNGLDLGVVDEQRDVPAIIAEGRVGCDDDVLLGGVFNQGKVGKARVTLDLINGGDNASGGNDAFQVLNAEVGDTDGAGLGLGKLGDGLPGLSDCNATVKFNLAIIGNLGELVLARLESDWPMNEVEVKVVELQLGQCFVQSSLDIARLVLVIPQLGGNEDVLTLQARNIGQCALDALSDLFLVAIDLGQIKVAVACLESLIDTIADLARCSLPGAVSNTRNGVTRIEGDGLAERHLDWYSSAVCFMR